MLCWQRGNGNLLYFAGVYLSVSDCAIVIWHASSAEARIQHRQSVWLTCEASTARLSDGSVDDCVAPLPVDFHRVSRALNGTGYCGSRLILPAIDSPAVPTRRSRL